MKTTPETKPKTGIETANPHGANPMWGGHYSMGPAEAFAAINPSISVDKRLWREDIEGSIAHATMLSACGILSAEEAATIADALTRIAGEIADGTFVFSEALEDIHMNIESRLAEHIGPLAGKLHTARSRNDQVATDFRLFVRSALAAIGQSLQDVQAALIAKAEAHVETILPGLTHLQPAQPVSFAHHLLAYVEMFGRDRARICDASARLNECPLGAAALAGTSYPINREMTAEKLGFARPMANSLDAVSDRDFVLESLGVLSIIAVHLSRLSEEIIFWANPACGFIRLPENFTSGSSIMPQKRNPDAAELIRGKTGVAIGALMQMLTVMKSLPLAYNKDTQEDKAPLIRALDDMALCLSAMTGMIAGMEPNAARMREAANHGYLTATDLADWLVQTLGLPFREAHHITGRAVKLAESQNIALDALSIAELKSIHPGITPEVFSVLSVEASLARRTSSGGTAPLRVREALASAKKRFL
jgi:argininosuccinate lyase